MNEWLRNAMKAAFCGRVVRSEGRTPLYEGKEVTVYRLQCDCGNPAHTLDVRVLEDVVFLEADYRPVPSLRERLWAAIRYVWGRPICSWEFVLRVEDRGDLAALLKETYKE